MVHRVLVVNDGASRKWSLILISESAVSTGSVVGASWIAPEPTRQRKRQISNRRISGRVYRMHPVHFLYLLAGVNSKEHDVD